MVRGGVYGEPPDLNHLDNAGNLTFTTDFRLVYATILGGWLSAPAQAILGGDFGPPVLPSSQPVEDVNLIPPLPRCGERGAGVCLSIEGAAW